VFKFLNAEASCGVEQYKIFEVYEDEPVEPVLGTCRINFQDFDGTAEKLKRTINPPIRPGAKYLWGWVFDSYFADRVAIVGLKGEEAVKSMDTAKLVMKDLTDTRESISGDG